MHTMLRIYTGMPGAGPRFAAKKTELEKAMRGVSGFAGYRLLSTPDGIASVTICETEAGCQESARVAAAWIKENLPDLSPKPPQIVTGESLVSFGGNKPPPK
jgi:hypothetical protein